MAQSIENNIEVREVKDLQEVVKYHNDLNTVVMRRWSSEEMNFFFTVLARLKNHGTDEVHFDTDELKELIDFDPHNYRRWIKTMEGVANKVSDLKYIENTEKVYRVMPLFQMFEIDKEKKEITVQVTSKFEYILNQLTINFTYYKLEEFIDIKSTYAKTIYRHIKQFKKQGKITFSIDELKNKLDMPNYYKSSHIDRLAIKPMKKELSEVIPGFTVRKLKSKKRGNPVVGYEFIWFPEKTGTFVNYSKKKQPRELTPEWLKNEGQQSRSTQEISEEELEIEREKLRKELSELENAKQTEFDEYIT